MVRHVGCETLGLNPRPAFDTGELEYGRGVWNSWCSGGMRRYQEEHQWRRQDSGPLLTLRSESAGLETCCVALGTGGVPALGAVVCGAVATGAELAAPGL